MFCVACQEYDRCIKCAHFYSLAYAKDCGDCMARVCRECAVTCHLCSKNLCLDMCGSPVDGTTDEYLCNDCVAFSVMCTVCLSSFKTSGIVTCAACRAVKCIECFYEDGRNDEAFQHQCFCARCLAVEFAALVERTGATVVVLSTYAVKKPLFKSKKTATSKVIRNKHRSPSRSLSPVRRWLRSAPRSPRRHFASHPRLPHAYGSEEEDSDDIEGSTTSSDGTSRENNVSLSFSQ